MDDTDNVESLLDEYESIFPSNKPEESSPDESASSTESTSTEPTQDEGETQEPEGMSQAVDPRTDELYRWAQAQEYQQMVAEQQAALEDATKHLEGQLERPLPTKLVESYLINEYRTDARFQRAFENRGIDPAGWESTLNKASRSLNGELTQMPDPEANAAVEAVTAAVRHTNAGQWQSSTDREFSDGEIRNMGIADLYKNFPGLNS